jgi:hypothetical protein
MVVFFFLCRHPKYNCACALIISAEMKDSNSNEFKQLARDGRAADKGTIGSQQMFVVSRKIINIKIKS